MEHVKISYNRNLNEYSVQVIKDGKIVHDRTYYTDDHDDAVLTKAAMEEEIERRGTL